MSKELINRLRDGVGEYCDEKNDAVEIAELVANLKTQRREYLALQAQLADAQKDAWIPVSERLPEKGDIWCLVYADGAMNCMAYYESKWKRWCCKEDEPLFNIVVDEITHWMPLPKSPIEVQT